MRKSLEEISLPTVLEVAVAFTEKLARFCELVGYFARRQGEDSLDDLRDPRAAEGVESPDESGDEWAGHNTARIRPDRGFGPLHVQHRKLLALEALSRSRLLHHGGKFWSPIVSFRLP